MCPLVVTDMNASTPCGFTYPEGSFAMEVRIFAEDPGPTFTYSKSLEVL